MGEDLGVEDEAVAVGGSDSGLSAWESLGEFGVGLVLVPEAAHESSAAAADLHGVEGGLLDLGGLHADGLQDLEEVLAAAVLAAFFVVGGESGLVAAADVSEVDSFVELVGEEFQEVREVEAFLAGVVDDEAFVSQECLGVDDFEGHFERLGESSGLESQFVSGLLDPGLGVHVVFGGDSEDAAVGGEGVVAAAGVVDVLEHLLSGDAFSAAGVGAGGGEHLGDLGAPMGADDDLAAAAGLGVAVVGELADLEHGAVSDDHGFGGREFLVGLAVGLVGEEIGLELWEGEDGHGERRSWVVGPRRVACVLKARARGELGFGDGVVGDYDPPLCPRSSSTA